MRWDLNSCLREMEARERQLWEQGVQRREVKLERKKDFICALDLVEGLGLKSCWWQWEWRKCVS